MISGLIGGASIVTVCLVVGLWAWWRKVAPKTTIAGFFVAGLAPGGLIGGLLGAGFAILIGLAGTIGGAAAGTGAAGVAAGLALVGCLELFRAVRGRKGKPERWHPILAFCLPTLVIASGIPFLVGGMNLLRNFVGV